MPAIMLIKYDNPLVYPTLACWDCHYYYAHISILLKAPLYTAVHCTVCNCTDVKLYFYFSRQGVMSLLKHTIQLLRVVS